MLETKGDYRFFFSCPSIFLSMFNYLNALLKQTSLKGPRKGSQTLADPIREHEDMRIVQRETRQKYERNFGGMYTAYLEKAGFSISVESQQDEKKGNTIRHGVSTQRQRRENGWTY